MIFNLPWLLSLLPWYSCSTSESARFS